MIATGSRALVTAAANGIGRATALRLASDGAAELILVDRERDALQQTAMQIRELGRKVVQIELDCTDQSAVETALAGVGPIDILVNAVGGSARGKQAEFWESDPAIWRAVIDVSLMSTMLVTRQIVPGMRERKSGRIISVSSDVALRPSVKLAEYAAAKAGVISFTRALATELGRFGINVNAVCPGLTMTRALDKLDAVILEGAKAEIPMQRIGRPEEIASVIAFLAGSDSSYMTGQTLAVNGGRSMI